MRTKEERRSTFKSQAGYPRILGALVFAVVLFLTASTGSAFTVYQDEDWTVQWDNTLKYSASFRVKDQDSDLISDWNLDDGNRNFDTGLVSNRADIFSELDITYRKCGIRISGAAWYDTVYNTDNDNDSPATRFGSGDNDEFNSDTERLHGQNIELLDAFFFARGNVGDFPVVFRAGRHTLLWGETLFFGLNGVAGAQAPLDIIKGSQVPGTQFRELLMPVGQFSGQIQLTDLLSVAAYWQWEWRRTRINASGAYLSDIDPVDAGGLGAFISGPGRPFPPGALAYRTGDLGAGNDTTSEFGEMDWNQWGISCTLRVPQLDTDFGLYYVRYHYKRPFNLHLFPFKGFNPAIGKFGEVTVIYPENLEMFAASFGTQVGAYNVSGEVSYRPDTPLVPDLPMIVFPPWKADGGGNAAYPIGDTFHANLSTSLIMGPSPLWEGGTFLAEVGMDYLDSVNKNEAALDPTRDSTAYGFRMLLEPAYYQVWPGWDLFVPIVLGYNPKGKSSVDLKFNLGGAEKGGDISAGVNVVYLDVWRFGVRYTDYFGSRPENTLSDRDFITLTIERTF